MYAKEGDCHRLRRNHLSGKLYIVSTPIGNLKDITLRAIEVLKSVDLIASEDTRVTLKLLNRYNIKKPLVSIHERSKPEKVRRLVEEISAQGGSASGGKNGKSVAFVSDAGTPGIADPGGLLVSGAVKEGIEVIPIPGPSAVTTALSIAGFPGNEFVFLGYFPKKKGRQTLLQNLKKEERLVVFFESPFRILKTLKDLNEYLGNREIVVFRELTKKFEEIYRGTISEVFPKIKPRGEFVVIIKGAK